MPEPRPPRQQRFVGDLDGGLTRDGLAVEREQPVPAERSSTASVAPGSTSRRSSSARATRRRVSSRPSPRVTRRRNTWRIASRSSGEASATIRSARSTARRRSWPICWYDASGERTAARRSNSSVSANWSSGKGAGLVRDVRDRSRPRAPARSDAHARGRQPDRSLELIRRSGAIATVRRRAVRRTAGRRAADRRSRHAGSRPPAPWLSESATATRRASRKRSRSRSSLVSVNTSSNWSTRARARRRRGPPARPPRRSPREPLASRSASRGSGSARSARAPRRARRTGGHPGTSPTTVVGPSVAWSISPRRTGHQRRHGPPTTCRCRWVRPPRGTVPRRRRAAATSDRRVRPAEEVGGVRLGEGTQSLVRVADRGRGLGHGVLGVRGTPALGGVLAQEHPGQLGERRPVRRRVRRRRRDHRQVGEVGVALGVEQDVGCRHRAVHQVLAVDRRERRPDLLDDPARPRTVRWLAAGLHRGQESAAHEARHDARPARFAPRVVHRDHVRMFERRRGLGPADRTPGRTPARRRSARGTASRRRRGRRGAGSARNTVACGPSPIFSSSR